MVPPSFDAYRFDPRFKVLTVEHPDSVMDREIFLVKWAGLELAFTSCPKNKK